MDSFVRRIFVEKRKTFDIEAVNLLQDIRENLGIAALKSVRIFNRYDVQGLSGTEFEKACRSIFSVPNTDVVYYENMPPTEGRVLAVEYLPGQYDQRADSAAQCVQLLTQKERPAVRTARVYVFSGEINDADMDSIRKYLINPVESREASLDKPGTLERDPGEAPPVPVLSGFTQLPDSQLQQFVEEHSLAMSAEDLAFCREYFRSENRDPTETELRVIDTYWSDHCRHTTFLTKLESVEFEDGPYRAAMEEAYAEYLAAREKIPEASRRDISLMDIALMGMRELKRRGLIPDLDESREVNACSIKVTAEVDGKPEQWLIMFKNETHNHPTEIEPFGGAATCLGGAIRDPLSGRSYVYQAMRVTGSGDPRVPVSETLPGKLPQRKITTEAARGFSSYGNQIGLCTGQVAEYYHPGYVAKRLELGAVIGAAPANRVVREEPQPGDIVMLIGGRTGRDGVAGATGSSRAHTEQSLLKSGAEVQKGNAPTERNLQRVFRDPAFSRLIKRCNDFGAGGVAVAIGELAPGLLINLDAVPKKYDGLDGTELAISESQERMACIIAAKDADKFAAIAKANNLEATKVAEVTGSGRMIMKWRGETIVDIKRSFLDTNGAQRTARAKVASPGGEPWLFRLPEAAGRRTLAEAWAEILGDLNICSKRGLIEQFDSSIGASAVLAPFGGKSGRTPAQAMVCKLPVENETSTCTIMSHGFDPYFSEWSPFHGAAYAVVDALAKVAAAGGDALSCRLSLQEYFERLRDGEKRWGKPLAALLGAFLAQIRLGVPAIGGKDSMSGSFNELDVPPTLVAFAVCACDTGRVISPELKVPGHRLCMLSAKRRSSMLPDFDELKLAYSALHKWIGEGKVVSAYALGRGGIAAGLTLMAFGNGIGAKLGNFDRRRLFAPAHGCILLELADGVCEDDLPEYGLFSIGETTDKPEIEVNGETLSLETLHRAYESPLESVFPNRKQAGDKMPYKPYDKRNTARPGVKIARPRVLIPVFPGTNCEYDSARAFALAGAEPRLCIIRNLTPADIEESVRELAAGINESQIIMIPGGFSGGDEPDGSGKFIATTFRNSRVADAVMELLNKRGGLILGICNGFQALIKLGLVPYGEICPEIAESDPTLTVNDIGRHVALWVKTVVSSTLSPWLMYVKTGDVHTLPVSHGEGRFVCSEELAKQLLDNGQIATQYAGEDGLPSGGDRALPNGSYWAVEGITSPDGRVFGKMAHNERALGDRVAINIYGNKDQRIFQAGVDYFRL